MFRLLEEIEDGPGRKIGWMHGFIWRKNKLFEYDKYKEVWHGDGPSMFPEILQRLQETRQYEEHRFVEIFMLVIDFFRLLSFIVGVVVFFQGLNTGNLLTGIVLALLMGGLIYVLPFVRAYAEARLKRKLKDLLDQITDSYRNKGIEVRFPVSKKMFLVFFACPYCCDNYNFSSIEVWSYLANS